MTAKVALFFDMWAKCGNFVRMFETDPTFRVSLLSCSPGEEVYQLYGHTALRVQDPGHDLDVVFNYGIFSFKTDHFVWRFALGKTDYEVRALPFEYFLEDYRERGSAVVEQEINITQDEAALLFHRLVENVQPENCVYRYNYFTDNCTTKVRDMILGVVQDSVAIPEVETPQTYRTIIHQYTEGHPWAALGNDIVLGHDCDTILSTEATLFVPFALSDKLAQMKRVAADGTETPLVCEAQTILEARPTEASMSIADVVTPGALGWTVALVCIAAAAWERRNQRPLWPLDAVLFPLIGLAGIIVTFMFLFSEHPTISSNWQVWVLNPLPLLAIPWIVYKAVKGQRCAYHLFNVVLMGSFLLVALLNQVINIQDFCALTVPLALSLLVRSLSYSLNYYRK